MKYSPLLVLILYLLMIDYVISQPYVIGKEWKSSIERNSYEGIWNVDYELLAISKKRKLHQTYAREVVNFLLVGDQLFYKLYKENNNSDTFHLTSITLDFNSLQPSIQDENISALATKTENGFIIDFKIDSVLNVDEYNLFMIRMIFSKSPVFSYKIESSGSGFLVSNKYIVTNYHVVMNANYIKVSNENYSMNAKLLVVDKINDLAILELDTIIDKFGLNISIKPPELGKKVYTYGYPLIASMGKSIKVHDGIVSSNKGYDDDITNYQISCPSHPGNSGGPVIDSENNIVGIVRSIHTEAENTTYVIKPAYILSLLDDVRIPFKSNLSQSTTHNVELNTKLTFLIEINVTGKYDEDINNNSLLLKHHFRRAIGSKISEADLQHINNFVDSFNRYIGPPPLGMSDTKALFSYFDPKDRVFTNTFEIDYLSNNAWKAGINGFSRGVHEEILTGEKISSPFFIDLMRRNDVIVSFRYMYKDGSIAIVSYVLYE